MKNKAVYFSVAVLLLLSAVAFVLAMVFLPDTVPLQFSFQNEIRGWGSKYLLCVFLVIELLIIGIFIGSGWLCERLAANDTALIKAQKDRMILNYTGLGVLVLENCVFYCILYFLFRNFI